MRLFVKADVTKAEEVEAMVDVAVDAYERFDAAFNNAGFEGQQAATADSTWHCSGPVDSFLQACWCSASC
jgi:NAD(P)-dependent dehydrogenase (short-subunit alcohol dehydrogenase family)